jgi:predicted secreted protein
MKPTNLVKSIDVILKINNEPVGGQQGAVLSRQSSLINITNKINGEWEENLTGTKSWSITCNGLYIIDSRGLDQMEEAFFNNSLIEVSFSIGNKNYTGTGLIVDFPLSAVFNSQFKYSIKILGTGELKSVIKD